MFILDGTVGFFIEIPKLKTGEVPPYTFDQVEEVIRITEPDGEVATVPFSFVVEPTEFSEGSVQWSYTHDKVGLYRYEILKPYVLNTPRYVVYDFIVNVIAPVSTYNTTHKFD